MVFGCLRCVVPKRVSKQGGQVKTLPILVVNAIGLRYERLLHLGCAVGKTCKKRQTVDPCKLLKSVASCEYIILLQREVARAYPRVISLDL